PDERRTYAGLLASAELHARALLGLGVVPGDRVGIHMANCFDFLDMELGCALIGVSVVPLNVRFRTHELSYVLNDSELRAVATNDLIDHHVDLAGILADAVVERPPRLRHLIALGGRTPDGFVGRAAFDRAAADTPPGKVDEARDRVRLRDEAMLLY